MQSQSPIAIRQTILGFMASRFPAAHAGGIADDTPLLTTGALDSLGVLDLMMFLDETYAIGLDDGDFDADNLATLGRLVGFVARKRAA
ncbi:acyl carrier protein [Methylobacterium gnaphalii]|uniref:Uncharacterized protein n=1 Tax=Methylobacterium gnaphalii TaxID=1010610 RepID=A0A512JFV9_9HYPH|nr:acyl carrier protein [Methylobacterium gnaphalii]GEP08836.1 hypothetical protein MGN01_06810 [Methylobacterium gnaphalii]GJD69921.1 hypothetical protein MMMDOFMJ_2860 [Methylobacterium gnaphalii]GLS47601.1 hypothetical protein GCM10007885_04450 [Methylobacterium gnaphalii]